MKNKEMLRKIYYENKAMNRNMQRLVNIGLLMISDILDYRKNRIESELED